MYNGVLEILDKYMSQSMLKLGRAIRSLGASDLFERDNIEQERNVEEQKERQQIDSSVYQDDEE